MLNSYIKKVNEERDRVQQKFANDLQHLQNKKVVLRNFELSEDYKDAFLGELKTGGFGFNDEYHELNDWVLNYLDAEDLIGLHERTMEVK